MGWYLLLTAALFGAGWFIGLIGRRFSGRSGNDQKHEIKRVVYDGFTVETSISTRTYNRDAYRFDGTATPQYAITYADEDGVITDREIYVDAWRKRDGVIYYYCWCFLRDERRTFRSDRILETTNLRTGRRIRDISTYIMR